MKVGNVKQSKEVAGIFRMYDNQIREIRKANNRTIRKYRICLVVVICVAAFALGLADKSRKNLIELQKSHEKQSDSYYSFADDSKL